jgi:hypothetical protein
LALAALTLTACNIDSGAGYVEIKAIPPSASIPLYLDQTKLDPLRRGSAVLRQKVSTVKHDRHRQRQPRSFLYNIR